MIPRMRRFVRFASSVFIIGLVAMLTAWPAGAAFAISHVPKVGRLRLHQVHTGESINVAYKVNDAYVRSSIGRLNHFLRDYRTGEDASYDPREFDLLRSILVALNRPNAVINVLCGYRSPETNAALRSQSAFSGVAENSLHIQSKAIDISIPGVSTERLRHAALSLRMGGVGYYPSSHFVHVDVGPVRQWSFGVRSRPHMHAARRTRSCKRS